MCFLPRSSAGRAGFLVSRVVTKGSATGRRMARDAAAVATGSVEDALGSHTRQQLGWLGFATLPLLFPVALPGMAMTIGALCVLIAMGVAVNRPLRLPGWLGRRSLPPRAAELLQRWSVRAFGTIAVIVRPRWIGLTGRGLRIVNGAALAIAGMALMTPVPLVSFDNVLPAAAVVMLAWGLRGRDGLLLASGYATTVVAVGSVVLLWWGGAEAVRWLLASIR